MSLKGRRILMFVEDSYEDLELWYPRLRLQEAGCEVIVAGPEKGKTYTGKHGYPCAADDSFENLRAAGFDALVISGGFAPDKLRRSPKVLELTREIFKAGKPLAHICHGGWIPVSAGVIRGFRCTSSRGIKDDIANAGGQWVDQEVVVDRNMISSRSPEDLPAFCRELIQMMARQPVQA
ncbi:MAG: type 1 glutamine amidotransferase [Acidobacteria bacterium]|nr:MAG: type 1 glutamine amidotransferase [Acidobacteriota bacterium]